MVSRMKRVYRMPPADARRFIASSSDASDRILRLRANMTSTVGGPLIVLEQQQLLNRSACRSVPGVAALPPCLKRSCHNSAFLVYPDALDRHRAQPDRGGRA